MAPAAVSVRGGSSSHTENAVFTGLIEAIGRVESVRPEGGGLRLGVDLSGLRRPPAPGASVAVDGACLTLVERRGDVGVFTAVAETARRTTLGRRRPGDAVNLEGALAAGDPLDGHFVLGHVDASVALVERRDLAESRILTFALPPDLAPLVAEKGSVAVDGVSLTVTAAERDRFGVSLIPETLRRTTLGRRNVGDRINLEADVVARYLARLARFPQGDGLTEEAIRALGRPSA